MSKIKIGSKIFLTLFFSMMIAMTMMWLFQYYCFDTFYYNYKLDEMVQWINHHSESINAIDEKIQQQDKSEISHNIEGSKNNIYELLYNEEDNLYLQQVESKAYDQLNTMMQNIGKENTTIMPNHKSQLMLFEDNRVKYYYYHYESLSCPIEDPLIIFFKINKIDDDRVIINRFMYFFAIVQILICFVVSVLISDHIALKIIGVRDITEKVSEMNFERKAILETNDELEQIKNNIHLMATKLENSVYEREKMYAEIMQKNNLLKKSIMEKEKVIKNRKVLIENVTHELKNPLSIIESYTCAIKDGIKKEKEAYYLDVIKDEVKNINQLIENILEFSKMNTSEFKLYKNKVNIVPIIDYLLDMNHILIQHKRLHVIFHWIDEKIYCDMNQMKIVLNNLIINAIKYAPKDTSILIEFTEVDDELFFRIMNQFEKKPDKNVEKLWDRYYRGYNIENTHDMSYGLGLAIVKSILELHHFVYSIEVDDDWFAVEIKLLARLE